MQNPAFWCTLGSENGKLLAGVEPEGTAREQGLGGKGGDAEGIDVRGTKAPSRAEDAESVVRLESGECREFP